MTPVMFLAVAAGGACGPAARPVPSDRSRFWHCRPMYPLVNIGGSAMMGLLAGGMAAGLVLPEPLRLFIAVGFLGALTTFFGFALDAGSLLQRTGQMMSLVYICLSVGLSLLAFGAAYMLAGMLFGRGGG